ncbi:MAG: hypothetical protein ACI808_002882 [Paraglaciecola sp.]|jgi:hypothetical protein
MSYKLKAVSIIIPMGVIVIFMYWYQWGTQILSPEEVHSYMNVIEAQTQNSSARHELPALRKFLNEDDGKPIYTVNLYNFHKIANYPKNGEYSGTGEQAYDRFSETMISLMLKRGSHPIYGSYWSDSSSGNWDRIVIIRYRSRRDLVDLFATNGFAEASLHKWASLKEHERMLVQAIHIPHGIFIIIIFAAIMSVIIFVTGRFWSHS